MAKGPNVFFLSQIWSSQTTANIYFILNSIQHFFQLFSRLLIAKILLECEKLAGTNVSSERKVVNDAYIVLPFEKEQNLYQFEMHAETLVSSKKPIECVEGVQVTEFSVIPDLFPLSCNISIEPNNFYKLQNVYRECFKQT